jgi:hypothetical protein
MSSDIVAQLRASVTQCRALDRSTLLEAAAKEIERLRDRVADLEAIIEFGAGEDPVRDGWIGKDGKP